ncbi:BamA/TamA family outer membrane protein [Flavobacterium antarcticum]|uniref:translocation and assembly module lipoprotein TamL n=1 Tax=Flavobacterium antarcticum TaxID=271155 RepID=UPI00040A585D|nr:BamA/TamA family outer membrane protein [Flavobacterium antarcticum]
MNSKHLLYSLLFLVLLSACNSTKYVPEGDLLYTGGSLKVEDSLLSKKERKALRSVMEDMLRPKPNKSFLGLKPKLFFYNLVSEPKKQKGFKYWLKYKLGEAPVLFSKVDLDYTADVLRNFTENNGYFKTRVESDSTRNGRKATAEYTVKPGKQFIIKSITFPKDSTDLAKSIGKLKRRSLLKVGKPYSLDFIKLERQRIDTRLKEKGYYYFSEDNLLVQVDSTVGNYEVDLILKIKEETAPQSKEQFRINDIIVYPNYSINDSIDSEQLKVKSYTDFTIIDKDNTFDSRVFDRTLYFEKDDLYNRTNHNLSLNRLVNLGTFKFVKNSFKVADTTGNYLDAYYYLTLLPKKSFRIEVLAKSNSANYAGTELNVNWSNRNTFKGAELLSISTFGGLEFQMAGQNNGFNVYRFGAETSLIWPRFIAPIKLKSGSGFVPKTKALLSYEFQQRSKLYSLNTFKGSFGYIWKENIRKEHELKITDITYASPMHVTELYENQISKDESGALQKVIDKQLIFGPSYSYTYQNTMEKRKKNTIYFRGDLETAGTTVGLLMGGDAKNEAPKEILGVPFSQFVKLQADFRLYHKLSKNSEIASRIIAGGAYAYGNSTSIPFIKQFFIGGTNSIRAFRARSIGPGSSIPDNTATFLPDQSGDIKLEFSTEYRAKLYSFINGAVFFDAGNIWTRNDADASKNFSKRFLDEIAVGTGVGLRFDFSFLVLRTDFAVPLRLPYGPSSDRWILDKINLKSGVFNLAIGYPF